MGSFPKKEDQSSNGYQSSLDYNKPLESVTLLSWDDIGIKMMYGRVFATMFTCIPCVILNTMLVFFILTSKEFKTLNFSPRIIQAVSDIIGPGVAHFTFELLDYRNFEAVTRTDSRQNSFADIESQKLSVRVKGMSESCFIRLTPFFISDGDDN